MHNTQQTTNPFKEHKWEITLKIAQTFAELDSRGDPNICLEVMNEFLVSKGLQPMTLQRCSPVITHVNNTFFPPNTIQKQHIPHHITSETTTWLHNTTAPTPTPHMETPSLSHNTQATYESLPPPTPLQSSYTPTSAATHSSMPPLRILSSPAESDTTESSSGSSEHSASSENSGSSESSGEEGTEEAHINKAIPYTTDTPADDETTAPSDEEPAPTPDDEPTHSSTLSSSQDDNVILNIPGHQPSHPHHHRAPTTPQKRHLRSQKQNH